MTPVYDLTDDDYMPGGSGPPVTITRKSLADASNQVKLEYSCRTNAYNTEVVEVKDQAGIELYGNRPDRTIQAKHITDPNVAAICGQLILRRSLYVRNHYTFKLGWKYCLLEPMDLVTITDTNLGLSKTPVRILSVEEDKDGFLTITAEEFPAGVATATLYPKQGGNPYSVNYDVAPGSVNDPVIFEPPATLTNAGAQVWIGVSGGASWGGCDVWVSTDNATYTNIGRVAGPARTGVLTAPLPSRASPDTTDNLAVDLSQSRGVLYSGSQADATALNTLCYVDGELIAHKTATLTGANRYTLTYLVRGAYGTAIKAHPASAPFARLDRAIFKYTLPAQYIGVALYLKFTSFNIYGAAEESLANVQPYGYVPAGTGAYVAPPLNVVLGQATRLQGDGTVVPALLVQWTASPGPLLNGYQVEWQQTADTVWQSVMVGPDTVDWLIQPVQDSTQYTARVRAVNTLDVFSTWVSSAAQSAALNLTAPAPPTNLQATGGYRQVAVAWTASANTDIAYYDLVYNTANNIATAVEAGHALATTLIIPNLNLSETVYAWVRAVNTSGTIGQWAGPASATTLAIEAADIIGQLVSNQVADAAITTAKFAQGIQPVGVATAGLPAAAGYSGPDTVFNAADGKLYRYVNGAFTSAVAGADVNSPLTAVAFPNSLRPVEVVAALPTTGNFDGRVVYLSADGKLYRYVGAQSAWSRAVDGADIVANSVTSGSIAAGAITASQIQAGAVSASKLVIADFSNICPDATMVDNASWSSTQPMTWAAANTLSTSSPFRSTRAVSIGQVGGTGTQTVSSQPFPVEPGANYLFEAQAYRQTGGIPKPSFAPGVAWYDVNGVLISDTNAVATTLGPLINNSSWVGQAPSNAVTATLFFGTSGGVAGAPIYFGGPLVRRMVDNSLVFNGSISSLQLTVGTGANLVYNSQLDVSAAGWYLNSNTTGLPASFGRNLNPSVSLSGAGTLTCRITGTPAAGTAWTFGQTATHMMPIVPGAWHEFSCLIATYGCQAYLRLDRC